jgi:hypothetical protein
MVEAEEETAGDASTRPDGVLRFGWGTGDQGLPALVRSLAARNHDATVVAWTSDLMHMRKFKSNVTFYMMCFWFVLLFTHGAGVVLAVVSGLVILVLLYPEKEPITGRYWILSKSHLEIIQRRRGRLCFLPFGNLLCWKSKDSVTKIPLSAIAECRAVRSRSDAALFVKTSDQAENSWRGFEYVGCHLSEPEWFANQVMEQTRVEDQTNYDEAPALIPTGSTVATETMDDNHQENVLCFSGFSGASLPTDARDMALLHDRTPVLAWTCDLRYWSFLDDMRFLCVLAVFGLTFVSMPVYSSNAHLGFFLPLLACEFGVLILIQLRSKYLPTPAVPSIY